MNYFIYKSKQDDCVAYAGDDSFDFECGHYFAGLHLHGASWSGKSELPAYEDVITILCKEDYERLVAIDKALGVFGSIGCGLDQNSERKAQGQALADEGKAIIQKLNSEANNALFEEIVEDEKEALMEERHLSREDVDYIFDNYNGDYKDREIVCAIFKDTYDCGYEEAYSLGVLDRRNNHLEDYFDFERFGQDLVDEDEAYIELPSGKVAYLCY